MGSSKIDGCVLGNAFNPLVRDVEGDGVFVVIGADLDPPPPDNKNSYDRDTVTGISDKYLEQIQWVDIFKMLIEKSKYFTQRKCNIRLW